MCSGQYIKRMAPGNYEQFWKFVAAARDTISYQKPIARGWATPRLRTPGTSLSNASICSPLLFTVLLNAKQAAFLKLDALNSSPATRRMCSYVQTTKYFSQQTFKSQIEGNPKLYKRKQYIHKSKIKQ